MLRVLQERELERVGGTRTIKVDVRVIATTNRNLEHSVERKEFRQDLFFRLNVVPIHIVPLRQRKEDIPFLAETFMKRFARKHGVPVRGLSEACVRTLMAHSWPGNVRELQNVIERGVILSGDGGLLEPDHLGMTFTAASAAPAPAPTAAPAASSDTGEFLTLAHLEKRHIFAALARCQDNRTHAAKLLDISIRTLRNKLNEYNATEGKPIEDGEEESAGEKV